MPKKMTRYEAAQVVSVAVSTGRLAAKFQCRPWQGTNGDPPLVRIYVTKLGLRPIELGHIELHPDGRASGRGLHAAAGPVTRAVDKLLRGIDFVELTEEAEPLWCGVALEHAEPARIVLCGSDLIVERRDDDGWVSAVGTPFEVDALRSAVLDSCKPNR